MKMLVGIWKDKKLMKMIGITILVLILFRIGSSITIPGINLAKVNSSGADSNQFINMLNLLGGGGLKRFSIFSLGVSPFITASIIVQLLSSDIVKPLARWTKTGEKGKKKIDILTRILTLPFAILQSFAILNLLSNLNVISLGSFTIANWIYYIGISVAGCYASLFLADVIGKYGIGNGTSLIIFAGIVANLFSNFFVAYGALTTGKAGTNAVFLSLINFFAYIVLFFILIIAVVFINDSKRKIPIQQTGSGLATKAEEMTFIPIKVNPAGVIPVIFASSILTIPITIAQFLPSTNVAKSVIETYFTFNSWVGISIYFVLTLLFTFFYAFIQVNPNRLAENFKKNGSFIPGIRPGDDTEKYIGKVLTRVTVVGALFLAVIASIPYIINVLVKIPSGSAIGGTGIVILIQVSLDWYNNIRTRLTKGDYSRIRKEIEKENNANDAPVDVLAEFEKNKKPSKLSRIFNRKGPTSKEDAAKKKEDSISLW